MFLQQMDDRPTFDKPWMQDYKFHLVDTIDKLKKLVDICIQKRIYSIDTESTGVDTRVYPDEYFDDGVKTRHGMRTIDRVVGVCISFDGVNGYYVPLSHEPEGSPNLPWDPAWDELERLVHSGARAIFHNVKFDAELLYPLVNKETWKVEEHEDTFLMAKIINPLKGFPSGLKPLSKVHFNVDMIELSDLFTPEMVAQLKREKRSTHNFAVLHPKEGLAYGCSDGIFTYKLYYALSEKLSEGDKKIYNLEKSFCNVLRKMERNRVHIDVARVKELAEECDVALTTVGDIIRDIIESKTGRTKRWLTLNVGSPKQLSQALITDPEGLRLKPTQIMLGEANGDASEGGDDDSDSSNEPAGDGVKQYTLKDEALKSLHEAYGPKFLYARPGHVDKDGKPKYESIFELIIEWRHYLKMKGSYIEPLSLAVDKNGDVRPDFRQMGTDTARLASRAGEIEHGYSGINFQGIPRDSDDDKPELFKQIRTCIIPRPGWMLVKLDFAGEELRVVTNLSGDPIWTDSFLNKDGDVHSITAKTLFGKDTVTKDERNRGKRCNFAFIYGGGAGAIQRNIGCSMEDAQRHMENLKRDVPVLMGYVDHQKNYAKRNKCIYTAYGRRIPIQNIDSPVRMLRSKAERCAINYTIQSTSADILKFAMCYVDKNIKAQGWEDRVRYVLTVHDEVVYEIRPELLMEAVRKLDEWMTVPWKLPKAHGRDWVVPLLTEPGIDINWKARYDYFKMVDGIPAEKKHIDADGKYTGKLKKDEYFHNGRVYQKVPEFLASWIRRLDQVEESPKPVEASVTPESASIPDPDINLHNPQTELSLDQAVEESSVIDEVLKQEPIPEPSTIHVEPEPIKHNIESPTPKNTEVTAEPTKSDVFRFVIRAALCNSTLKKLHALCILADGDTPIRIVNPNGKILVSEEENCLVEPTKFKIFADLFGLC
jgi:DNA polymerase I-like protein with 3'-5' exonuclease and polymerase domains